MTDRTKQAFAIAFIFLAALAMRWWYMERLVIPQPVRGDALQYVRYANNIMDHGVFSRGTSTPPQPDGYFTPGYPLFLVACIRSAKAVGVDPYQFLLSTQAVIGALTAVLTFLLARLCIGLWASITAALLTVLSPHLVSHGGYILTETLFGFLLALALYLFASGILRRRHARLIASGGVFGYAYLVNPIVMFAPLLLTPVALIFARPNQTDRRAIVVGLLLYLAVFGAWQWRNKVEVAHEASGSADRIFWNFIIGMHSDYHEIWRKNPRDPNNPADLDRKALGGSYQALAETLWQRVRQDPGHYLSWYLVKKPLQLWGWDILIGQGDIYVYPVTQSLYSTSRLAWLSEAVMKSLHYWLVAAALLGLLYLWRDERPATRLTLISLYVALVYISVVYVLLHAEPRYSVPLQPEMHIGALYFLSQVFRSIDKLRRRSRQDLAGKPIDQRT
ncbi:MAG: glycosyltransferase family 39 protein [Chromatiaceae bacterium]|nr:glycosyltransferase family 39 protein [Chromatiaceae bacterium]MCP5422529.1 glycosyltransferase family 39 protein [Chromatiaceae bacterium]